MATQWISPTWRMPENSNQNKVDNYSLGFDDGFGGEYITFNSPSSLWTAGGLSVSFWLKTTTTENDSIITMDDYGAGNRNWQIEHRSSGNVVRFYVFGSSNVFVNTSVSISDGNWHHLVFTYEPSTALKVYIDGSLDNSNTTSIPASRNTDSANLRIATNDFGSKYTGNLSHVSIFDYALSQSQVDYLYNSGTPQNPMAISGKLPITYYSLGGGSTGDAGTSPSTLTVPNDSVPSATVFDFDTADYVSIPHTSVSSAFSVSAWIKTTDAGTYGNIFSSDEAPTGGTTRNWQVIRWNAAARFILRDSGGSAIADINGGTINDGNWHHVLATWDGTTETNKVQIYVDGTSVAQGTASSTALANSAIPLVMGGSSATWDFIGDLSNIAIWSSDQSTNIVNIYNNGVPQSTYTTTPEAWYKMNVDTSTWDGTNWVIGEAQANYSSALDFDGVADYVELDSLVNLGTVHTISWWEKSDGLDREDFIANPSGSSLINGPKPSVLFYKAAGVSSYMLNGNAQPLNVNLNDDKWHNISIVRNGASLDFYIDGLPQVIGLNALVGTEVFEFNSIMHPTAVGRYSKGTISNLAVFTTNLSAANIITLYNNGTPQTSPSFSPTGWWKLNNTTTGIEDSAGSNNGTNNGATVTDIQVSTLNGLSDGMTTANLVTSDLTRSIPYSSYSMVFDGIDDEINFSSTNDLGLNNTVSMWVNLDSGYSGALLGESSYGSTGYFLLPYATGFFVRIGTTSASASNVHTYLTAGSWHNLTVVRNAGNFLFYVDGAFIETVALSSTTATKFDIIGNSHTGADPIEGNISNVCGFNSILTEDQILTIYNGGVPNDISSLSPTGWWSLGGDSYYDGTNWICPDLSSGSNNGTSDAMGGTELVGDGPGSTANGVATNMNIPEHLKGDAPNSTSNAFSINMTAIDRIEYDVDAKAFINAAGITDATQQLAIKTLVSSLQNNNLWTNMKAIYPMVGGTAIDPSPHKYNLKDPQDTDAAFRLTFAGGWTHSATGATPNGLNGIANSHIVLNDVISSVDAMSYGYYSRDTSDVASLSYEMGTFQSGAVSVMLINYVGSWYYQVNDGSYETIANSNTDGFFVANRSGASALEAYRNGSLYDTENSPSNSLSTLNFGIGGIYGANGWGSKECAFAFIYDGSLDATQNSNLYNAVQAFNTTLGRQV